MSAVPVTRVRAALADVGLLVAERGDLPASIASITDDSRQVAPGACFVAVRGSERDGHDYLSAAERAGASMAIVETEGRTSLPHLVVRDGRRAAAIAAAAFYHEPARALRLVAVTGTSGKTTTVSMLRHLLDEPGAPSASIGTLGVLVGSAGEEMPGGSGLTTPGPVELQRVLRALVDGGVRAVAMEVSSHSLDQRRVEGVRFAAGIFTNLSRDHLDYHGTMEAYLAAKAKLVEHLTDGGVAVINADDPAWGSLPPAPRTVRFGLDALDAEVRASDLRYTPTGSHWTLHLGGARRDVTLPLIGDFNVLNALGAAAAAWALGVKDDVIAERVSTMPQVPGRLERILDEPAVLRDYSHKPDALDRALRAVRPFVERSLILVFGCGGDRDRGKRPVMGEIAERLADLSILTSDNPRTEDPEAILDEIEAGMSGTNHERVEDRRDAIARALEIARPGDVVVLAGKGHETYQIRGTTKYPFDERVVTQELASEMQASAPHAARDGAAS
jgi:UDP-N-acetylmuramoyl-L-alanyl-D-glutamate--2,6-diaminopimelate ligase